MGAVVRARPGGEVAGDEDGEWADVDRQAPLAVYDSEPGDRRAFGCMVAIGVAVVLGCFVLMLDGSMRVVLLGGMLGGFAIVVAAFRRRRAARAAGFRVEIHRDVVLHETAGSSRRRIVPWQDVRVRSRVVVVVDRDSRREKREEHRHLLTFDDGSEVEVSGLALNDFHQQLVAAVQRCTLPRLRADVQAGKTVRFGGLKLSRAKITFGPESRYWSELTSVELNDGVLRFVDDRDRIWLERELADFDDGPALAALAKELLAAAHDEAAGV